MLINSRSLSLYLSCSFETPDTESRTLNSIHICGLFILTAFFVGFFTFFAGLRFVFILLFFFVSSSAITNVGEQRKKEILSDFKKGGQRNYIQVLSNGLWATILCLIWTVVYHVDYALDDTHLQLGFTQEAGLGAVLLAGVVGHYACCCGDTWASELGVLSNTDPFFVLNPLRKVPVGTNGGITPMGLLASVSGGAGVGFITALYDLLLFIFGRDITFGQVLTSFFRLVLLGAICGLIGSLIDSVLGATLQYSGLDMTGHDRPVVVNEPPKRTAQGSAALTAMKIGGHTHISGKDVLDNNQVNALSSFMTSLFAMAITAAYLGLT